MAGETAVLPGVRVEAEGEAAERMLACVQACSGIPTASLQAGWLSALLDHLEAFYTVNAEIDCEWEQKALEFLGRLDGPPACAAKGGCRP